MTHFEQAYAAIDAFISIKHSEFYPSWLLIAPSDWGANGLYWRQEADEMVVDFERRIGFEIDEKFSEIDKLRTKKLEVFCAYLVAKADAAVAKATVKGLFQ